MRRTKEEAEATRQAILRAALTQFSEQGYSAARLSDVAEAAGVTRGAIYHHFENKGGLYGALLEKYAGAFGEKVMEAIGESGSFLEICSRVFVYPLAALERDEAFAAFYELVQFHTVAIPELEAAHEQQRAGDEAMLQNIAGYFQMGMGQGAVRPELDARELAHRPKGGEAVTRGKINYCKASYPYALSGSRPIRRASCSAVGCV